MPKNLLLSCLAGLFCLSLNAQRLNWFHILGNTRRGGIREMWQVFCRSLGEVWDHARERGIAIPPKRLIFHVNVLEQHHSFERFVDVSQSLDPRRLAGEPVPEHWIEQRRLRVHAEHHGWVVRSA